MLRIRRLTAAVAALAFASTARAALTPIVDLYNTGVETNDPTTGLPTSVYGNSLPESNQDAHWLITSAPAATAVPQQGEYTYPTPFNPFIVADNDGLTIGGFFNYPLSSSGNAPWAPDTSTSEWIGPHVNEGAAGIENVGVYDYVTTFTMAGPGGARLAPQTASITGSFFDDDAVVSLSLNGTVIPGISTDSTNVSPDRGGAVSFTIPMGSPFIDGTNTISILIQNDQLGEDQQNNPTGLNLQWTGSAAGSGQPGFPEPASACTLLATGSFGLLKRRRKAVRK